MRRTVLEGSSRNVVLFFGGVFFWSVLITKVGGVFRSVSVTIYCNWSAIEEIWSFARRE